jgi:hypothetical protein
VPQKPIVKIIVVGAAQVDGKLGHANLADMHETGRIDHRSFDIALVEGYLPIVQRRNEERRTGAAMAGLPVPSMMRQQRKVEHCFAPFFVVLRQILENIAFDFTDVTVRIDHLPFSHHIALSLASFDHFSTNNSNIYAPTTENENGVSLACSYSKYFRESVNPACF